MIVFTSIGKFEKEIVNEKISKLEIVENNGILITKYDGKLLKEKPISTRYESFDFKGYVSKVMDEIVINFKINSYELIFKEGVQQIILKSDEILIDGESFIITFFILNSTDKSRALNVSLGLKNKNYTFITEAGTIYKKHYKGINEYVDDKLNINTDVFKEQLELIKSLKGEEISLKDIKKVITTSNVADKYLLSQESVFINFMMKYHYHLEKGNEVRTKLYNVLYHGEKNHDFYLDSYTSFIIYLSLFIKKDSYVIKNESERILRMSKYFKRRNILNMLNN